MSKLTPDIDALRAKRDYDSSDAAILPILRDRSPTEERRDLLLRLYAEICGSWRALLDVRFKLLLILPTVSLVAFSDLLLKRSPTAGTPSINESVIATVGLIVTTLLVLYDQRNCELYLDLIGRGRKIEDELGVDTGQFRGRIKPPGLLGRDRAIKLTYLVIMIAWGGAIFVPWIK